MSYCIYKLSINDKCYIGKTKNFKIRMYNHKSPSTVPRKNAPAQSDNPLYTYIKNNGGWDNVKKEILEKDLTNDEAKLREQYYYDNIENLLNVQRPLNDKKEYNKKYMQKKREDPLIREKINGYNRERVSCPHCNTEMARRSLRRHIRKIRCPKLKSTVIL